MVKTRQGWMGKEEVVEVWFDQKVLPFDKLLAIAEKKECARTVWTSTESQQQIAKKKIGERAQSFAGKMRLDKQQKYYLLQSPLKGLAMSEAQASRVNAVMDGNWKQFLSPSQVLEAEQMLLAAALAAKK